MCSIRRLITKEFLESLQAPSSGETWIADTKLRGFGIRLWASKNGGAQFCVRTTDRNGKTVRRTFDPYYSENWASFILKQRRPENARRKDKLGLSFLLEDARDWAKSEIARIKGVKNSVPLSVSSSEEYRVLKTRTAEWVRQQQLGYLVEIVLQHGHGRGWSEIYCDRLRNAFDKFEETAEISKIELKDIDPDQLTESIERAAIGSGNIRLLRTLLNVVLQNVRDLGGPAFGDVFPRYWSVTDRSDPEDNFLSQLSISDFEQALSTIRLQPHNWRSRYCVELCFYFFAPAARVMNANWRQVVDGMWFPYSPGEVNHWRWRFERIDFNVYPLIKDSYERSKAEGLESDYWFPSINDPKVPIKSFSRVWFATLKQLDWPRLSLKRCAAAYRQKSLANFQWEDPTYENIKRELNEWLPKF